MHILREAICLLFVCTMVGSVVGQGPEQRVWLAGFAKVDVTPTEPVRLSGYGTRDQNHTGIADRLYARAMVLTLTKQEARSAQPANIPEIGAKDTGAHTMVMVSVDSIAIVGSMTRRIEEQLQALYGLTRSDFVLCSTHSHAAPHAAGSLPNMFRTPLSSDEQAAIDRYAAHIESSIVQVVQQAMTNRQPARLEVGQSQANFAMNRRVLKDGLWTGFGQQRDGPVDHRVRVLRATDPQGKVLGAATMYACHCTTLGPDFNEVSGDWAGLAAIELEAKYPDAVFLPVIGCGADANPEPRTGYEDAKRHGHEMAASIEMAMSGSLTRLTAFPVGHFGYAGLAPEIPSKAELEAALSDKDVYRRRWAEQMLSTLKQMGRLPETYPAPVHTWSFGEELVWVFLGGEVVVDYQFRLEKELKAKNVWVAAYTDDVFAYVASERMRSEGGYEVDFSMLYYGLPGRWQSGTEDLIARRTHEILSEARPEDKPLDAQASWQSIHVPDGYAVDLMASEPMVNDPVNIAFGHDGRVWVAEMSDYPLGAPGGGRVRWLRDTDGDGQLDQSQVFLDGLNYPSSVTPWRDGVIVITSPAIFFAADRDGDGRAEVREELLQGIAEANPQHRASGFELGLDGWLNFTSGDNTQEIHSTRNDQRTDASRRDVRWNPDTGQFTLTAGHTQFVRARDEFGNWFGNVNNQPMFHYVIEDQYRVRAGFSGASYQHLTDPPIAPPVYPTSRTVDRFNDIYTSNRFTSACSSIVCRVPGLGEEMRGCALVCEPVHNLIARFRIVPEGATFKAVRFEGDNQHDFFASSDPFSRPVRVVNAPDGTLWVADMVRQVIEHPEWIPTAWQERLNLRAGTGLGRLYRIRSKNFQPNPLPKTEQMSKAELLSALASDNGALRDLAQQQLLWRSLPAGKQEIPAKRNGEQLSSQQLSEDVAGLAIDSPRPAVRAQALGLLAGLGRLDDTTLTRAAKDADPRVRRYAASLANKPILPASTKDETDSGVLLQWALTLGNLENHSDTEVMLEAIARHAGQDAWLAKALALVSDDAVPATLSGVVHALSGSQDTGLAPAQSAAEATFLSLWSRTKPQLRTQILSASFTGKDPSVTQLQVNLLCALADSGELDLSGQPELEERIGRCIEHAIQQALDETTAPAERRKLLPLIVLKKATSAQKLHDLVGLLGAQQPPEVQQAALDTLRRLKADETAEALISAWRGLLPDIRTGVQNLLLERRPWGQQLVSALEQGKLTVNDLDPAILERLRTFGDRNLMARTQKVLGAPPTSDRAQTVKDMLATLKTTGNVESGLKVFNENCAVCHRATPDRPIVGAPLENISNWTQEQWVVAILDPNRSIEPKYHQYVVVLHDGRTLAGVIEDRSSHHLTLAAPDGKRHEVELPQIESLKDLGTSMMPEGLEKKLDATAMADLLAYLETLRSQK